MTAKEAASKLHLPIDSQTIPIYASALGLLVAGVSLYFDVRSRLDRHEQLSIQRAAQDERIEAKLDKFGDSFQDLRMSDSQQNYRIGAVENKVEQLTHPNKIRTGNKNTASTEFYQ